MEFDAGMSRFEAETAAAKEQGLERWEAIGEIGKRLVGEARDKRAAPQRDATDDVPGVQPAPKEKG